MNKKTKFLSVWEAFEMKVEFEQNWLNKWINRMSIISNNLIDAQINQKLVFPQWIRTNPILNISDEKRMRWFILESYVHMTNNRLGILNRDEAFLAYLIKRSLQNI